jgi:exosortase
MSAINDSNPIPVKINLATGRVNFLLPALVFGFLWFTLINNLRVEWTLNPQYSYGWAVPLLCAYLIRQNLSSSNADTRNLKLKIQNSKFLYGLFVFLALLYFPTRLLQEANPEWRLTSWALAIEVVGLTLLAIYFLSRSSIYPFSIFRFSHFVFPICFFLVAVPWPTSFEQTLIQTLTHADAKATTELLGWLGVPALPLGNVIRVATGEVGIDEACSGIRSFQATLMISLFLGEFYRLNLPRRLALVLGGFAMSILFNLARMSILVWIAAKKGIDAIAKWHDPTGLTILIACFCGLWGLSLLLAGKNEKPNSKNKNQKFENASAEDHQKFNFPVSNFTLASFTAALALWILFTEISVAAWYHVHEMRLPPAAQWTVALPTHNPTFKNLSLPESAREILRYDESRSASWQENNFQWQAIFLRWNPGRTAVHLAQNHTPAVCLTAAGHQLNTVTTLAWFEINGMHLPFAIYEITDSPQPVFVFYCLWDDRATTQEFQTASLTFGSRLAPVFAGLRNPGQRSLEIAVNGANSADEAKNILRLELEKIINTNQK